ncbi:unnamed protein product [Calicophoron daubneyi]|uniref:Uncharacterized protein n=1 Tax=Calicophoron daubneyi TaxID=300641 RepID=A0AAV2TZQ3_CALDB
MMESRTAGVTQTILEIGVSCISQYHGARCDIYSPLKSIPDPKLTDRQKDDLFGCKNGCDSPPGRVILISAVGALLVTLFLFLMCFISQACYKKQRAHKTSASIISHDFQNQGFQACRTQLHNSECPAGYANVANLEGITPSSHCFALMHQNTENLLKVDENRSVSLSSPSKVVDIHLPSPQPIRPCLSPRYGADEQRVEKYPSVPSLFNYFLTDVGRFNTPVQMSRRSVSLKSLPRDPQPSEQSHTHEGSAGNSHNCHPKPEAQYRQNNYARSRSTACNVYSKRDNFFLSSNQSSSCTVTHPLDTINDDNRYFILDTCPLVMQPMPDLVYQNQCLDWNNTYKYPNSLQINTVQRFAHQQYSQPNDPKVSPCHFDIIRQSDPIYEPETASNVQTFLRYNTVQGLPQTKSRNLKYVQVQSARRLRC